MVGAQAKLAPWLMFPARLLQQLTLSMDGPTDSVVGRAGLIACYLAPAESLKPTVAGQPTPLIDLLVGLLIGLLIIITLQIQPQIVGYP